MKTIIQLILIAGSLLAAGFPLLADYVVPSAPPPEARITSLKRQNNQILLAWQGGRGTYQLQTRTDLQQPWRNLGSATTNLTAAVPINGPQAFFREVADFTARYQVVFNATWSQETHPYDFPVGSAHWSGLVGGVHNTSVSFWREGQPASEGIRRMAEQGAQSTLLSEIRPAITNGTAQFTFAGSGLGSPGSTSLVFPEAMTRDFPLVTLCSMIAPSPDWFVGVSGVSLLEDDRWAQERRVTLFGFDAGTDSGSTFISPDQVTTPSGVITRFSGFPALVGGRIVPFGTFTFLRLD